MVTLATWNINSVRARVGVLQDWLTQNQPDILMLQEIKCTNEQFPAAELMALGYHTLVHGQQAYNGVAILSRLPLTLLETTLPGDETDIQARFISAQYGDTRLMNIYAPNGNPVGTEKFVYKLSWLKRLETYLNTLIRDRIPFVIGGDFNIIPTDDDARHPHQWIHDALFQPESRLYYRRLINMGLTDAFRALHPLAAEYSFWDYQAGAWNRNDGIRIDHFLLSPKAADRLQTCVIDRTPRGWEKPSDHTPVIVTLDIPL